MKPTYSYLFEKHVFGFLQNILEIKQKKPQFVVAVSGGVDSMALLFLCVKWQQSGLLESVRCFHFNHGTRKNENLIESTLIEEFCKTNNIELIVQNAQLDLSTSNFEHQARKYRYHFFLNHLRNEEYLLMGHHLNDSWEWSQMQKHKSSHLKSSLGIPCRRGQILRPFMSVSKVQITRYALQNKIPFALDSSNHSDEFERNRLRNLMTPFIQKNYPQYLKHYVRQSQQALSLIKKFNKDILRHSRDQNSNDSYFISSKVGDELAVMKLQNFIQNKLPFKKSSIFQELIKINQARFNHKFGPLPLPSHYFIYYRPSGFLLQKGVINLLDDLALSTNGKCKKSSWKRLNQLTWTDFEKFDFLKVANGHSLLTFCFPVAFEILPHWKGKTQSDLLCQLLPRHSELFLKNSYGFLEFDRLSYFWRSQKSLKLNLIISTHNLA